VAFRAVLDTLALVTQELEGKRFGCGSIGTVGI
jgi:hypothetical protein